MIGKSRQGPLPSAAPTFLALAWSVLFLLTGSAFAVDRSVPAHSEQKTILVLGDSLAAGYGLDQSEAFPALLQEKIDAQKWNWRVVNAGVSGDTTAGGLRRLEWLLKQPVDVLLLELGGNDGLRGLPPEVTKTNLQAIIDRTRRKYPQVQVVITGMRMPPNFGADYVDKFQKLFRALATENHAAFVPFLLEGVGGESGLNQEDRIHPTAEGHRIVAENVWRVLKPLLQLGRDGPDRAARES